MRRGAAILACLVVIGTNVGGAEAARRRPPARSPVLLREKDVNLDQSLRLAQALRAAGIEVVLTRDRDLFVPLGERSEVAHRTGADMFLSIHNNASRNRKIRGTEIYYQRGSSMGRSLARSVLAGITTRAGTGSRGTFTRAGQKGDDYYAVLRNTRPTALIIEGAYLSNPEEARALADPAVRQRLADGITTGVLERLRTLPERAPGPGAAREGPAGLGLATPANLSANRVDGTDALLAWEPVAGATAYAVWRNGRLVGRAGAAGPTIGLARQEAVSFRDQQLGRGVHRYEVRALSEAGDQIMMESNSAVTELMVPWKVVVDPGHGGKDPGAIGRL